MPKNYKDLRAKMSPAARAEVEKRVAEAVRTIPLSELRKARELTQAALAANMKVDQAAVSKIENRTDLYLSTLRGYVEAMGGRLELRADFPDGSINIGIAAQ